MSPSTSRTQRSGLRSGRTMRTPAAAQRTRSGRRADGRRRGAPPSRVGVAGGWIQRRQPEKKQASLAKALGGLGGAASRLGIGGTKPSKSSSKGKSGGAVGGVALLTAAAGLAFKNRQKVAAMFKRDERSEAPAGREDVAGTPATGPATGVADAAAADPLGNGQS